MLLGRECLPTFTSTYSMGEEIGRGTYGVVYRCVHQEFQCQVAVKAVSVMLQRDRIRQAFSVESRLGKLLNHPNIARFYEEFFEYDFHYLIYELVEGRDLLADICNRVHFSETEAKDYIMQILEAVRYCHARNIVHCNVEPTNILLHKGSDTVKLIDFETAKQTSARGEALGGRSGFVMYMAPEMVKHQPYGKAVDIWSCGLVFYNMLSGVHPFPPPYTDEAIKRITNEHLAFSPDDIEGISDEAISLVKRMICLDQEDRILAEEALNHSYITNRMQASCSHRQRTLENLRKLYNYVWGAFDTPRHFDSQCLGDSGGDHNVMISDSSGCKVEMIGDWLECTLSEAVIDMEGAINKEDPQEKNAGEVSASLEPTDEGSTTQ